MNGQIGSGILDVTSLSPEEISKRQNTTFEFWGPTPAEARKAAVGKRKGLHDKRTSLKDAVSIYLKDGINIDIGGFVDTRVPVSI
ncbi:MAG: CoA transferase subunit A, partial [Desulfobacterales bacterium]|nr:CoA transferase subunit A [Desulfobacterales bacterium]